MEIILVGFLEYGMPNMMHLVTVTKKHETGANHTNEVLHRLMNGADARKTVPIDVVSRVHSCTRENNNKNFFACTESLFFLYISKNIEISVSFIGHRHGNFGSLFSITPEWLRSSDVVALHALPNELRATYIIFVGFASLKSIGN